MEKNDLEIIIGFECNNNCIFCSNKRLRDICIQNKIKSPTTNEVKEMIDKNKGTGIETLFFVGGEPTIFKNFFKIVDYSKKKGYSKISIQTNGRMLKNMDYAKKICKKDIEIGISVHSNNSETHDKITKTPGSFHQLIEGMNNLQRYGKDFRTNTVINNYNYKQIPEIITFFSKYNPTQMLFSLVSPVGMNKQTRKKILPDLENLKPIIKKSILVSKKFNQNIKFIDIPLCLMKEYEEYMQETEINKDRKILIKGKEDFFYINNKNKKEKEKFYICNRCKREKECFGLWKGYKELKKTIGLEAFK